MKTIRQNTFETNSSSTHAISFSSTLSHPPEFIPVNNGPVIINVEIKDTETWKNKVAMLGFITEFYKESPINTKELENILSSYTGFSMTFNSDLKKEKRERYIKGYKLSEQEWFSDNLSGYFTGEYGFGSDESFLETLCEILKDEEKIKRFCFSENLYVIGSYYDG